ncbi:MAG: hypothetical protein Q8N18_25105 [Opitutaceae bacterium]|nr:hypothetical protein [Opitutaceae bacterium]
MNEPDHHRPTGALSQEVQRGGGISQRPSKPAPKTTEVIEIPIQLHAAFLNEIAHRAAGYDLNGSLTEALRQFVEHAPAEVIAAFCKNPKNNIWAVHAALVRDQVLGEVSPDTALADAVRRFLDSTAAQRSKRQ